MASPSKLGRYELREVLGKGAMGVVYEGFDPVLGRRVAIKTILPNAALGDDVVRDFAMRFTREAKAAARLSHPNIVGVYDFGVENDLSYLVMEYVQGTELGTFFDSGELFELRDVTLLMTQLLDALELAHNAGIVHRDIKPANVMVDNDGNAKLADFGVARVSDGQDATQVGAMVGTPAYMSPEQVQGQPVDRRTDIFSAGVILYQFLTGQKPFQGGGAYTLARKIIHDDPVMPSAIVPSVSPAYDRVIRRALAKNADERYQTAREFSQALNALAGAAAADAVDAAGDDSTRKISLADLPTAAAAAQPDSVASGLELEFWRSIKDSQEFDEFELYLSKFPSGMYAELAQRKVAKLKRASTAAAEEAATLSRQREEQARAQREAEEAARRAAEEKVKLDAQAHRAAQMKREAEAEAAARRAAEAALVAKAAVAPALALAPMAVPSAPPAKKSSMAVPAILGVLAIAGACAAYFVMQPKAPVEAAVAPAVPAQPTQLTAPAKLETRQEVTRPEVAQPLAPAADAQKPAEKAPREIVKVAPVPAPAVKPGAEALSKAAASKAAADAAAKAAADLESAKSAAERAAAQAAAATAAAEQRAAAAEQRAAAAEKAAADRAAAEKTAAEKAAAERAASEKAAAGAAAAAKAPTDDSAQLAARRARRAKQLEWDNNSSKGGRPRSQAEIDEILRQEGLVPGGTWKSAPAPQAVPAAAKGGQNNLDCNLPGVRARNMNC